MRYNIHLWSMVYILYVPTCVVGLVTEAVPGQNISLPCMVKQVNNQQIIKWWGHNGYISSGKMFTNILGATTPFYALPGAGNDYSLFIMIPDDIMIWTYLADTYECRLVLNNDDEDFQNLKIHELQIYQPECAIININGSTSVASCSYRNIQQFQETWLIVKDVSVACIRNCTSDICTLNYTYNPSEANPQDTVCNVTITGSMRTFKCTLKETHIPTLPPKTEVPSQSISPTKYIDVENSQGTMVQSSSKGTVISSTITTAAKEDNATQLIVIISLAAIIILFLVITILYFIRRSFKNKQNSAMKSPPTDKNEYIENDQKEHTKKFSMLEGPAQSDDINFKQSSEDSVMKENVIYQSADTNAYELTPTVNKVSVAKPDVDQTNKAYEEIDDFVDGINMNKKNDGHTTSQTHNKDETFDDFGYIEKENEAYQSLDDEFNVGTGN
ncbi:uncharacterized protein LOC117112836 isoform X1 [Anneissia japonica]|uniref:uncharacterized protein LOC117112836 isoform X1 n=1 Tax=Anneissia japonica TaxID=1529436 RepID=UPI001425785B|nr:uncharacterized protein LOC117112836 isoform X1 [Anneissia japonica]